MALQFQAPLFSYVASQQATELAENSQDEENKSSDGEESISEQPIAFKVHKANGRAISQSKCQHCESGSYSKFYVSGNLKVYL